MQMAAEGGSSLTIVSFDADIVALLEAWGPDAALGVITPDGATRTWGESAVVVPLASVTKLIVAVACLVAVEEGTLGLDQPAGPPGSTVRHLLAHASGLDFDSPTVLAAPATRRIYSNSGFEALATTLAAESGLAWEDYVTEAVLAPLGMTHSAIEGSAAWGVAAPLHDVIRLGEQLRRPTLISRATWVAATTAQFPHLDGVLPGFGTQRPNPWGLGCELRGQKHPHWTGARNSPETFGHFGASGTFLWVDPGFDVVVVGLGGRRFGPWAVELWPRIADRVIDWHVDGNRR